MSRQKSVAYVLVLIFVSVFAFRHIHSFKNEGSSSIKLSDVQNIYPRAIKIKEFTSPFRYCLILERDKESHKKRPAGYAFLTNEAAPKVTGYAGPISILVVTDLSANIRGIKILEHNETMSYAFGIEEEWWTRQFIGLGPGSRIYADQDVDGLSQATVTVDAICMAVRKGVGLVGLLGERKKVTVTEGDSHLFCDNLAEGDCHLFCKTNPKHWTLIPLSEPADAQRNMAFDEMLLDQAAGSAFVLRFYRWSPPAVSCGYFQNVDAVKRLTKASEQNLEVVRRITGGGIVHHGEDLTVSIVVPVKNPFFAENALESYRDIHLLFLKALRPHFEGLKFADIPIGFKARKVTSCFDEPMKYDLVIDNQKKIGSSQRRRNGYLLHHTAIFLDMDPKKISDLIINSFKKELGIFLTPEINQRIIKKQ